MKLVPEFITKAVMAVATVVDAVVGLLPDPLAAKVRESRKAIATFAGGSLGFLAALNELPLPANVAPVVAAGIVLATAVVVYLTPNAEKS